MPDLYNRAQPIIRCEVTDFVTLDDRPCLCGRPTARITGLLGRGNDMLELEGVAGGVVRMHPIHLRGILARQADVLEYQIVQDGPRVTTSLRARPQAANDLPQALSAELSRAFAEAGARAEVLVQVVDRVARDGGAAKLKLVRRLRSPGSAS